MYMSYVQLHFEMIASMLKAGFNQQHPGIIRLKKEIRNYFRRQNQESDDLIIKVIKEDDYGYADLKALLPVNISSREEADDYFMRNLYRECRPSQYDCTGQHFTLWHKLTQQNGRWVAYFREGMDV